MSLRVVLLLVLALAAMDVSARSPERLSTNRIRHMRRGPPVAEKSNNRALMVDWIEQKLDHFDALDTTTWMQRYFYSADAYVPGGPVFLYLAGEWEANGYEITSTYVGDVAAQHGAFMIDLEHRYYGLSHPTQNITTPNLQWLNADQALEDAAVFTVAMMNDPRFNLTGPWVVIGGSYSANLAAWARARYPHLYHAAWASSGPVLAQLDFIEYYEVVDDALTAADAQCPVVIQAATDELDALVAAGDSVTITQLFNFCNEVNLTNPDDVMNVYSYYSGYFAGEVQYARYGNLNTLCSTIIAGQATPLATIAQIIRDAYSPSCLWASNQNILDFYKYEIIYTSDAARQWFYQACVEYGYWQSLSSLNQPFGQSNPVEYSLLWCSNVYGPEFTKELNEAGIARTNMMNGGLTPDVTRVLYVHGSLDPWHALGIQTDLNADAPVIMIDGESHCRDIGTPDLRDSQALQDARVQIANIIASWLPPLAK